VAGIRARVRFGAPLRAAPGTCGTDAGQIISSALAGTGRRTGRNTGSPGSIGRPEIAQCPGTCATRKRQRCSP